MAMIDDIMQQLQGMGIDVGGGFSGISQLGAGDIANAMRNVYGLSAGQLPSSMFQTISSSLIEGSMPGTYSPQIQATGQTLLGDMLQSAGGQKGIQAAGGFAGSGQFGKQQASVKDVYGKSMTDTLTSVRGQQSQGIGAISDLISQWNQMAQRIKGI